jgi:predicted AlkP superfamily pyrophosphatase or phosphodiesterase
MGARRWTASSARTGAPRWVPALLLATALLAAACTSGADAAPDSSAPTTGGPVPTTAASPVVPVDDAARALINATCQNDSHEVLLRTWHGIMPSRSGDISIIPKNPDFVNSGLSHATPFDYTQDVPMLFYGPGFIQPGVYTDPVTLTDIAPTEGDILKFPFDAPDGHSLTQALLPAADRTPPKLLVTLVWDSGGMDVLNTWKKDTPYFNALRAKGAWFSNASVGSSPSNTPPGHAAIGTGAFPMHTGYVDDYMRVNGKILSPTDPGPQLMKGPTLGDLYDRANDNKPIVGAVVSLAAHVMMMSHGSYFDGGDKDLAITRQFGGGETAGAEAPEWTLSDAYAPYYTFPAYANSLPPVTKYTPAVDALDGKLDGLWRGTPIEELKGGFDTPARTPYQTRLLTAVLKRESFGKDDTPDLLYVNYKAIDTVGHLYSLNSPQMSDTMKYQDQALRVLVQLLNKQVGRGQWAMVLTADHGTQYDPAVSGAFPIDLRHLRDLITAKFDTNGNDVQLIEKLRPTQAWFNYDELASNHVTLTQISKYILGLTQADTITGGATPNPATANQPVFSSVLPTSLFTRLPCLPEAKAG